MYGLGLMMCIWIKISGFHTDAENHWVAELEVRARPACPPRSAVDGAALGFEKSEDGAGDSRISQELNCVRCDEFAKTVIDECRTHEKEDCWLS